MIAFISVAYSVVHRHLSRHALTLAHTCHLGVAPASILVAFEWGNVLMGFAGVVAVVIGDKFNELHDRNHPASPPRAHFRSRP